MTYTHVMTVYDGTPESEDLLDMVCRIARPHHAQLTILHIRLIPLTQPLPEHKAGADPELDALVHQAERFADKRGAKAASAVHYGRTLGASVVAEARTRGIDLLALLAPDVDKVQADHALGADIEHVLRKATCAVIFCRPKR